MWSGALVSCGWGFLSLTLELEAQPILILSRPCLFKALLLIHMHTATFHFCTPSKVVRSSYSQMCVYVTVFMCVCVGLMLTFLLNRR